MYPHPCYCFHQSLQQFAEESCVFYLSGWVRLVLFIWLLIIFLCHLPTISFYLSLSSLILKCMVDLSDYSICHCIFWYSENNTTEELIFCLVHGIFVFASVNVFVKNDLHTFIYCPFLTWTTLQPSIYNAMLCFHKTHDLLCDRDTIKPLHYMNWTICKKTLGVYWWKINLKNFSSDLMTFCTDLLRSRQEWGTFVWKPKLMVIRTKIHGNCN